MTTEEAKPAFEAGENTSFKSCGWTAVLEGRVRCAAGSKGAPVDRGRNRWHSARTLETYISNVDTGQPDLWHGSTRPATLVNLTIDTGRLRETHRYGSYAIPVHKRLAGSFWPTTSIPRQHHLDRQSLCTAFKPSSQWDGLRTEVGHKCCGSVRLALVLNRHVEGRRWDSDTVTMWAYFDCDAVSWRHEGRRGDVDALII